MIRIARAPNLALATLWADMLRDAGFETSVQRAYSVSIAGEIPPGEALPEIWIADDAQFDAARRMLAALRRPRWRHWLCRVCGERIDGPFDQCWACGADMPAP